MNEEQASYAYWDAVSNLKEIIESGERGSKEDILDELRSDLN